MKKMLISGLGVAFGLMFPGLDKSVKEMGSFNCHVFNSVNTLSDWKVKSPVTYHSEACGARATSYDGRESGALYVRGGEEGVGGVIEPRSIICGNQPVVVEVGGAGSADFGCHGVEFQTLGARNAPAVGVVGPGGEQQQAASGAGVEILARRLVFRGEAVFAECDKRQSGIQRCAGDCLFAGADAGAYQNGSSFGSIKQSFGLGGEFFGRDGARALDLQAIGAVEQKRAAVGGIFAPGERQAVYAREIVGVGANERQPARVVGDVAKEGLKLAAVAEYAVVIAGREETVVCGCHIWRPTQQHPVGLGAADLEAAHDLAEMAGHALANEKQPVEVVGHDHARQQLNLGVKVWNRAPTVSHGVAQRRMNEALALKTAQQRASALDLKCNHVDATLEVVVAKTTLGHFPGEGVGGRVHGDSIANGFRKRKAA